MNVWQGVRFSALAFAIACVSSLNVCLAGTNDAIPDRLNGVGIEEHLGDPIPLNVRFRSDNGGMVSFGDLLQDGKPILLTLNYSDCPGLCVAQLNGLAKGINDVGSLSMGKDFKMVSLSIDPRETLDKSQKTKAKYVESLYSQHAGTGWSFLTGTERDIQKIARSVGFNYTFDAKHNRYNHSAAAIFVSPEGRISRYLYEVGFEGPTLKMALLEAGEGKIGTTMDAFVLWCSHYDASENRYSSSAQKLLSIAAGVFVLMGVVLSIPFWISRRTPLVAESSPDDAQETLTESIRHTTSLADPITIAKTT